MGTNKQNKTRAMTEALRSDSPAGLGKTLACVCDVTDQEKVNEALSLVKETFGGIGKFLYFFLR